MTKLTTIVNRREYLLFSRHEITESDVRIQLALITFIFMPSMHI